MSKPRISVSVPDPLFERIAKAAKDDDRSISKFVAKLLEREFPDSQVDEPGETLPPDPPGGVSSIYPEGKRKRRTGPLTPDPGIKVAPRPGTKRAKAASA